MKRYLVWFPLAAVVALVLVLGNGLAGGQDPAAIASPLTGAPAPALHVAMFGQDGRFVTADDLKGRKLLVNFFASWCGPCAAENKLLLDMAREQHIRIIGIAMKDDPDALQAYLDKRGDPYALIGFDAHGETAIDWGVSGVPETFVIDAHGNILERHIGQLDGGEARHIIDLLQDPS